MKRYTECEGLAASKYRSPSGLPCSRKYSAQNDDGFECRGILAWPHDAWGTSPPKPTAPTKFAKKQTTLSQEELSPGLRVDSRRNPWAFLGQNDHAQ